MLRRHSPWFWLAVIVVGWLIALFFAPRAAEQSPDDGRGHHQRPANLN